MPRPAPAVPPPPPAPLPDVPPPPPPWAAAPATPPTLPQAPVAPVRVGGNIRAPAKTRHVDPVYPAIALSARVQGIVFLGITIGADGYVEETKVLRSPSPLLEPAAITAVRQWQYEPTLMHGVRVPVTMTVMATFTLK